MKRRKLLKIAGLTAASALTANCFYLSETIQDEEMKPGAEIEGKVLCDLHCHPNKYLTTDETADFLGSPGLVGLTQRYTSPHILTYEIAKERLQRYNDYKEITPGHLAKFQDGYFARTQEVEADIHHILAIGFHGDYIPDYPNPKEAIAEIHTRSGISILNHPYSIPGGSTFHIAKGKEEERVKSLVPLVNEVEVHNAFNINYYIFFMKQANQLAEELIQGTGHKGVSASDCHDDIEQAKICGIYIDKDVIENEGIKGIQDAIKFGNFEALKGPYISKWSFTKTMVFPRIQRMLGLKDNL
tara:strand:- start:18755 stop:19654 length:900 start_codon:yes stop_codon:yes gene_type:complete